MRTLRNVGAEYSKFALIRKKRTLQVMEGIAYRLFHSQFEDVIKHA